MSDQFLPPDDFDPLLRVQTSLGLNGDHQMMAEPFDPTQARDRSPLTAVHHTDHILPRGTVL